MHILLLQLDGKIPNLALTRIASHHIALGHRVWLEKRVNDELAEFKYDMVYASAIFKYSLPNVQKVKDIFPKAIIGGTGYDEKVKLEDYGIYTKQSDYSLWPSFRQSIGFTQRGCRLRCEFCVVPRKEGRVAEESSISDIWRGDPYPKEVLLLDNDFFGQPNWRARINEILKGGYKVSFNQGINVRFINEESAAAIASVPYYDDGFKHRRIYTAWDSVKDAKRVRRGIELLLKAGVAPSHIMVYMLIGYWPGETAKSRDYRRRVLRSYGVLPYPMPYVRTPELVGFQRWVILHYDQKVSWKRWKDAGFQAYNLEW